MKVAALAGVVLMAASGPVFGAACSDPANFSRWLQNFKQQAVAEGVSPEVVSTALQGVIYDRATIGKDRAQGVFSQSFLQFSDRMVSKSRLQTGAALLKKNAKLFRKIEEEYGVPGPVLIAFWGLETDFGAFMGKMETLRSLATLAFDCRRPEKFTAELIDALRVVERGDLSPAEMRGPAHGEVGQFQFQPSVYYQYAVDFDGDGRRDMIRSNADALASAANYLKGIGWQAGQPWLEEVVVPDDMDWSQADVTIKKPRSYWAQSGVTYRNGDPIPADETPTGLVLPMGRNGPAFLAYPNFDIYTEWNHSLIYCTTAGYLATRLAGAPTLSRGKRNLEAMPAAQIKEVQLLLKKRGYDVGKIDGVIGAATRVAIREMQAKYGLPADSYPTVELLAALRGGR